MENSYLINHTRKTIIKLFILDFKKILIDYPNWHLYDKYEIFIMRTGNDYYPTYLLLEEGYISGYANDFLISESEWRMYNRWRGIY